MPAEMNSIVSTVEYRPQQQESPISAEKSRQQNQSPPAEAGANGNTFCKYPTTGGAESLKEMRDQRTVAASPHSQIKSPANVKTVGSYKSKRVFKVIIIGDAGVGKTCLSYRFCNGHFPGPTEATIGVDFRERCLVVEDQLIRVQLWDTAGQERYRQSIVAHYYRNVNAVVFVYDVNNIQSFKSLPAWIAECKKHALTSGEDTPHILIGNKCDLQSTNERVKTANAQVFADENDMALFETSALADSEADHVESIFLTLVHKLRQSKAMHVQSSEERSNRGQQKILLKAHEAENLRGEEEEDEGGICC